MFAEQRRIAHAIHLRANLLERDLVGPVSARQNGLAAQIYYNPLGGCHFDRCVVVRFSFDPISADEKNSALER